MKNPKVRTQNPKAVPVSRGRKTVKGFTLLEILVGAGILTAIFLGVLTVFDQLAKQSRRAAELTQVALLLEEGLEVARVWRDQGWANLGDWPAGEEYYLEWVNNQWATTSTAVLVDNHFERTVKVEPVSRDDTTQNIVTAGGSDDPNTKLVTVSVAWGQGMGRGLSAYFTNIFEP